MLQVSRHTLPCQGAGVCTSVSAHMALCLIARSQLEVEMPTVQGATEHMWQSTSRHARAGKGYVGQGWSKEEAMESISQQYKEMPGDPMIWPGWLYWQHTIQEFRILIDMIIYRFFQILGPFRTEPIHSNAGSTSHHRTSWRLCQSQFHNLSYTCFLERCT